ncbi:MAG TPA: hypothetical protein VN039_13470, partial [Nitrospira sp.]|nr:hypothetical protein [Nitrospira sp.]
MKRRGADQGDIADRIGGGPGHVARASLTRSVESSTITNPLQSFIASSFLVGKPDDNRLWTL